MFGNRMLLVTFLIIILLSSCYDESSWKPAGKVIIRDFVEIPQEYQKLCKTTYSIQNIGKTRITKSTISFNIETDKHTYFETITIDTVILAGKTVWNYFEILYHNPEETATQENVKILDAFFE